MCTFWFTDKEVRVVEQMERVPFRGRSYRLKAKSRAFTESAKYGSNIVELRKRCISFCVAIPVCPVGASHFAIPYLGLSNLGRFERKF